VALTGETVETVDLALSVVSLALLLYLLAIYVRLYRQLRQRFTLGFILFTVVLIAQVVPGLAFHALFPPPMPDNDRGPPLGGQPAFLLLRLFPNALELVALAVLVGLSRE
jgi:hypothetical protein